MLHYLATSLHISIMTIWNLATAVKGGVGFRNGHRKGFDRLWSVGFVFQEDWANWNWSIRWLWGVGHLRSRCIRWLRDITRRWGRDGWGWDWSRSGGRLIVRFQF